MAYNRHFINKRKSVKVHQINSSARISPPMDDQRCCVGKLPNKTLIDEARQTGILTMADCGMKEIPADVYNINRPDKRRLCYDGFNNEQHHSWWEDVLLTKLDLSSNNINKITDDVKYLNNLLYLDLQNNDLQFIPNELCELTQLRYLNVCNNKIGSLPDNIGTLSHLQQFHLGRNSLKNLPIDFCRLLALEVLDLSSNEFTAVPNSIGNFIKLRHLSLAFNKMEKLPETISKLKALTFLDISQNKFSEFPKSLDACFEVLKMSVNFISKFPINQYLPSLKELRIDNNEISSVTSSHISYIPNISILTISKNSVLELPNEITDLHCLTHLDISFNNLQSIPYALGNLDSLQNLCVEGNPFRSINRTALNSGTEILKRYLRTRNSKEDISCNSYLNPVPLTVLQTNENNKHSNLDIDAHELNSTGTVDLSNRGIKTIPDDYFEVLKFKKLLAVLLSHNKLVEFPIGIFSFASTITKLDISYNRMLELPNAFNNFNSLQSLNLNGNYLRSLPDSFADLKKSLLSLEVAHNPLGLELPVVIFSLVNLKFLNVSNCAMVVINVSNFMKLSNLADLDLSNNEIEVIPPEFGLCRQIKAVNFDGNKIRNPALTHMSQGTEAVFEFLRSQIQQA